MKRIFFVSSLMLLSLANVHSQISVYKETFGTPMQKSTKVADFNGWSNTSVLYSGISENAEHSVDIRNNKESEYANGAPLASEGGNVYFNGDRTMFVIKNINASGYYKMKLSFGMYCKTEGANKTFEIYYSINNGSTKKLLKSFASENFPADVWQYISEIDLPDEAAVANLQLYFELGKTEGSAKVRLDDIGIVGLTSATADYAILSISKTFGSFETTVNQPVTQKITVTGSNLSGDVTVQLKNNQEFSLSQTVIPMSDLQDSKPVSVKITFSPTTVKYADDTLVINTQNLPSPLYILLEGKSNLTEVQNLKVEQDGSKTKVSWDAVPAAEKYLITVARKQTLDKTVIFKEDFSGFKEKTMTVSGKVIDFEIGETINSGTSTLYDGFFAQTGWSGANVYIGSDDYYGEKDGVCRLGKKAGGNGWLNSPAIDLSGKENVYMSFKIRTFTKHGTPEIPVVKVGTLVGSKQNMTTLTTLYPEFEEYIFSIEPLANTKLRFYGNLPSVDQNNRYIIDDVEVFTLPQAMELPLVKDSLINGNSFTIEGLTGGAEYEISVRAYCPSTVFVSSSSVTDWVGMLKVSYSSEYGEVPSDIFVEKNTLATQEQLPELQEEGYIFLGWYDGDEEVKAGEYEFEGNVTLVAKWEKSIDLVDDVFADLGIELFTRFGNLQIVATNKCNLLIYNSLGQLIHTSKIIEGQNDICCLPEGVYFLRIGNRTKKIVVN